MLTQGRGKRGEEIKKRKIIIKKLGSKVERFYEKFREVLLFFFCQEAALGINLKTERIMIPTSVTNVNNTTVTSFYNYNTMTS
jgi:hypothetical protein